MTRCVMVLAVALAMIVGCASTGTAPTVTATAGAVLNTVQSMTATYGAACSAGLLPAKYCQYVQLAWFAEQQLAAAWDAYVKEPSPASLASFEAAKCAAQEAANAAERAKAEEGVQ